MFVCTIQYGIDMQEKKDLRKHITTLRNEILTEQKAIWDRTINEQLELILGLGHIQTVHTFIPMGNEVNILPTIQYMLNRNIKVVCPKSLPKRIMENRILTSVYQLESGMYGTQHPTLTQIHNSSYDLIIVPGLAFDKNYYRMGYGAGYYDTFLAQHPNALKIGVCYPFQLVDEVPIEAHDVKLDGVIY
jgi:5-formyltetrahydrofolate cyclo-ligase